MVPLRFLPPSDCSRTIDNNTGPLALNDRRRYECTTEENKMANLHARKLISNSFNKLHEHVSTLRSHVEQLEDPVALGFLESMELGLLAPMRRLRIHLDIPYDWHDKLPKSEERVA
jgi:hypothetical protein